MKLNRMNLCDKECRRFQTKEQYKHDIIRENEAFANYLRWNFYKVK